MKKSRFFALVFCLVFPGVVFSKTQRPTVITYDYAYNKLSCSNPDYVVIYRHALIINIINANPFLYKITINSTPLDYFKDVPKVFKDLSGKETDESGSQNKPDKNDDGGAAAEDKSKPPVEITPVNSRETPNLSGDIYKSSLDVSFFYRNLCRKVQRNIPFERLDEDVQAYCEGFVASKGQKADKSAVRERASSILHVDLKKAYDALAQIKSDRERNKSTVSISYILSVENDLDSKSELLKSIDIIFSLLKKENFEKSITIPTVDCDEIHILPKIEGIDDNVVVPYQLVSPIVVRVRWGWKIDFSTGVLFQINANDQDFILEDSKNDTNQAIIKKNYNSWSFRPTTNILLHVYPRSARSVKWGGLSFGLGTGDVEKINYFLGTSFMMGLQNRFIINAGFTAVKIKTLGPQYEIGQEIPKKSIEKAEDLLTEAFKIRFFFGITYNLSTK